MTLQELRSEYEARVIGTAILEEVRRACASHTRRYPPAVYARSQAWNRDAVEELVQDVAIERLLGEQQLAYLFDAASDLSHWRALLNRQVKITLARRRVRTVVDNLLDRAGRRLARSEGVETGSAAGRRVFRRAGSRRPYRPLTDQEVRHVTEQARLIPRRRPGRGERAPSVYSDESLGTLLGLVLREAPEGGVAVRDLGKIFEMILTDWIPAVLELEETDGSSAAAGLEPSQIVEVKMTASQLTSDMTPEEILILRGYLSNLSHKRTAEQINVSVPTLLKRHRTLFNRIHTAAEGFDESGREALMEEIALRIATRGGRNEIDT